MNHFSFYESMDMPDPQFPIKVHVSKNTRSECIFPRHWHEHLELLYFIEGRASVECSHIPVLTEPGDLVVVNSHELHYGECISDTLTYYYIIIDINMLLGHTSDACQAKYISPIAQNLIVFKNRILGDGEIAQSVKKIIEEYLCKETGYELEITSCIYHLLVLLLRNHVEKALTEREYGLREKNMQRFNEIFRYIEVNYALPITLRQCAAMLDITPSHFCHLFKLMTGKTLSEYINHLRIQKAQTLLRNTGMPVTEIALEVGFNDIAYFSRLFRKRTGSSPSTYRIGE